MIVITIAFWIIAGGLFYMAYLSRIAPWETWNEEVLSLAIPILAGANFFVLGLYGLLLRNLMSKP